MSYGEIAPAGLTLRSSAKAALFDARTEEPASDAPVASVRSISAVIVTYFTGPLLARSIAAALAQSRVREVIVVDNGNWPSAVDNAIAAALADSDASLEGTDVGLGAGLGAGPGVRVITGHGNVGFARACNMGAVEATGEYLLFINPDAVLPTNAAERLLADGVMRPRPWVVAPKLVDPDGCEQQGSRRATLTPWRAFVEATKLYRLAPRHPYFRRFNLHAEPCPKGVTALPVISGACFLTPREDYFAIGGMDERYFLHVEDVDFCLRFANSGGVVYFDPNVAVTHYKSSSRVNPLNVEARKTASILRYFRHHFTREYPAAFLWLVGCLLWLAFGAKAATRMTACAVANLGFRVRCGEEGARRARSFASQRAAR